MQLRRILLAAASVCAFGAPAFATDYYVSTSGNDANTGRSTALAWRSLARVNAAALRAGDRVLLQGGATFTGSLTFDTTDGGTPASPLTVTSYGVGRATVSSGSDGISVYNRAALRIVNVRVAGNRAAGRSGISFFIDRVGSAPVPFIRIEDVEVSGFAQDGIQIGTWSGGAGFSDVRIVRTLAHDNVRTGILTFADRPNVHRNVYVGYSRAYNNRGARGTGVNTGSGIVLGNVDGGTIERSIAHDNGDLCDASEGPVGIWTYDSTGIVIQHNESYRNRTGGTADGGGFDLDQNVSESLVQFNYSHDNDGAGYLLAHRFANDVHRGNVVRYNISENDGRKNGYSGIEIWGRTVDAAIAHNTVVLSAAPVMPRAFRLHNASIAGVRSSAVRLLNNLFYTRDPLTLVEVSPDQQAGSPITSAGNVFYSPSETTGDPGLTAAFNGGSLDDASWLEGVEAYRLVASSPVRDTGVDVHAFGVEASSRDFFGGIVDARRPDPGAHEFSACVLCAAPDQVIHAADASMISGAWRLEDDPSAAAGRMLRHPDAGAAKRASALASPVHFFDVEVEVNAGQLYRVWLRGRADRNASLNDSVFVQFADSLDEAGRSAYRIATTSALAVNLEPCSGCGLAGWMWRESGWGTGDLGPLVQFASSGRKRLRIQTREDGIAIDQVVVSSRGFVGAPPGRTRNDATILARNVDAASEVVLHARDLEATDLSGAWHVVADASAADGVALWNPDRGVAKRPAAADSPADHADFRFVAKASTPYRLWVRLRAQNNSGSNDSVFVTLDDGAAGVVVLQDRTGAPITGWGWNDTGWASMAAPVGFETDGPHRLRVQPREDGVYIDQVVLSPERYFFSPPGPTANDTTIVGRSP